MKCKESESVRTGSRGRRTARQSCALLAAFVLASIPTRALGGGGEDEDDAASSSGACSSTARVVLRSCEKEADADYALAIGKCVNIEDASARTQCADDAKAARQEAESLCREQRQSRLDVCAALGDARYDPAIHPADFDTDFHNLSHPNPYFPLAVGNRWEFGGAEDGVIEVLDKTKLIEGVTCAVVNDRVTVDGQLSEDTDDWFAQAKSGDAWYFGEQSKSYETFAGDVPPDPELVDVEGSFKAGREGDKPGLAFLAAPSVGKTYRQEFSLGTAEDVARILSTTYSFGHDADLDRFVPAELADLLCDGDCIVVEEFTPLEPGVVGRKYYAAGIGFFLEVDPESGDATQLVGCNFDTRCDELPEPQ